MINKNEFEAIRKDLVRLEELRETTIKISRLIINLSKQIIHNLHKNEVNEAEKLILEIKKHVKELPKTQNLNLGINFDAVQEYVEALGYYYIIKHNRLPTRKELNVDTV